MPNDYGAVEFHMPVIGLFLQFPEMQCRGSRHTAACFHLPAWKPDLRRRPLARQAHRWKVTNDRQSLIPSPINLIGRFRSKADIIPSTEFS